MKDIRERTLREVVGYSSGSSWDGTHYRSIEITFHDRDNILVENVYESHRVQGLFSLNQVRDQLETARDTLYFREFCYEMSQQVKGVHLVKDAHGNSDGLLFPASPTGIDAEIQAGISGDMKLGKPLQIKPKM